MTTLMIWSSETFAYVGFSGASRIVVDASAMKRAVAEFVRLAKKAQLSGDLDTEARRRLLDPQNWLGSTVDGSGGVLVTRHSSSAADITTVEARVQQSDQEQFTRVEEVTLTEADEQALDSAWQQLRAEDENEWQRTRLARRAARLASSPLVANTVQAVRASGSFSDNSTLDTARTEVSRRASSAVGNAADDAAAFGTSIAGSTAVANSQSPQDASNDVSHSTMRSSHKSFRQQGGRNGYGVGEHDTNGSETNRHK